MTDFMPLEGWDHVELWVGNAKQGAYFYEHAMGFTRTAYAGPETGVRDRASYVLEQGEIRLVLTSALREEHEITRHVARHGDGVKDIARLVADAHGSLELAQIATYGDTVHTFVNRHEYAGPFAPGYVSVSPNGAGPASGVGLRTIDHCVGNVELGRMNEWVAFYERTMGFTEMIHFSD